MMRLKDNASSLHHQLQKALLAKGTPVGNVSRKLPKLLKLLHTLMLRLPCTVCHVKCRLAKADATALYIVQW